MCLRMLHASKDSPSKVAASSATVVAAAALAVALFACTRCNAGTSL